MNAIQRSFGLGLVIGFALAGANSLHAQQPAVVADDFGSLYAQGVNAYFAGRSSDAESFLSQALAFNPQDPRAYYFRALSLMRLGRLGEARGDMMVGASLEAQTPNRFGVGRALERVQGANRLTLERYRRQGREFAASAPNLTNQRVAQPSRPVVSDDGYVLRRKVVIPLDRLLDEGGPRPLSADELASRRHRTSSPPPARSTPPVQAPAASNAADDPFRDDTGGERPAATGPRLSQPVEPAEEPPAEPAAEEDVNPFGDL
jgi:hypothetical protein